MLKDYVVMKAAQKINGKRGRTSLIRLLRGSQSAGICKMASDFDLFDLWGVFSGMSLDEANQIFDTLTEKGCIYTDEVNTGNIIFPMLYLTEDGASMLFVLESTEADKLREYLIHRRRSQVFLEITDRGKALNDFLKALVALINFFNENSRTGVELTDLWDEINIDYDSQSKLEKFIYRRTNDKFKDRWRLRSIFDITLFEIIRDLRLFLSSLTELEALLFRYHFNLLDLNYKSLDEILTYYIIPETAVQGIIKRLISHFSHAGWIERFQLVRDISIFMNEMSPDTSAASAKLTKETSEVTYDLFAQGLTIPEIARKRGLAVNTIYSHFIKLIPQHNIDLFQVIPQERVSLILKAIDSLNDDSLKAIKAMLPYDYNYGEIKLVMSLRNGWIPTE